MSPPEEEEIFKGISPKILKVPETWLETQLVSPGKEASMEQVLDSVAGLCKTRYDMQGSAETLAAEAEEVMKQMRAQIGTSGQAHEPGEDAKAQEMLDKLKAGSSGFARKSTQGKNNIC